MTDLHRAIQSAALPWRATEGRAYILNAAGMEVAKFSSVAARDLALDAVNGLPEMLGRVATLEADAENVDAGLVKIRAQAAAALEKSQQAAAEVEALQQERDTERAEHEKTRRYGEAFLDSLKHIRLICTDALGDDFAQVDGGCHDEMVAMVANRLNDVKAERDTLAARVKELEART